MEKKYILLFFLFFILGIFSTIYYINKAEYPNKFLGTIAPSNYFIGKNLITLSDNNLNIKIPEKDNLFLIQITGNDSMRPTIPFRAILITISNFTEGDLHIGDIIAINNSKEKLLVHRIVDIREINGKKMYSTKGDNNFYSDGLWNISQIKHKIVGILY